MDTPALDFFKFAALSMGMPNVSTRGLVLPPPRQKVLSNMVNVPPMAGGQMKIKPQFSAESSAGLADPGISQPTKAAEFMALEFFKMAQGQPFTGMAALKAAPPAPRPPSPANQATTRIIRKPAPPTDAPKTAEFSALAYFALLGQ